MQVSQTQATTFIQQVQNWATQQADIQVLLLIGSRTRTQHPADEWSDIDFWLFSSQSHAYFANQDWVAQFGVPQLIFWKGTPTRKEGLQVLYHDGLMVDFGIQDPQTLVHAIHAPDEMLYIITDTFQRGIQILVDKTNAVEHIQALLALSPVSSFLPTAEVVTNLICDYWYHLLQVMKKLQRGEIWIAWQRMTNDLAHQLLTMLEWHTQATQAANVDIWFKGRYLEMWADSRAKAQLQNVFPIYEAQDIKRAMGHQMELFRWLAQETTTALGYPYPIQADESVTRLLSPYLI